MIRASAPMLAVALLAAASCGSPRVQVPADFGSAATAAEESGPVGGVGLHQRRERLERLFKDLSHIRKSLDSARHRGDGESETQLARFAGAYLWMHLDPLLAAEWQSRHPELMALDAGLRLAEVELLRAMNEGKRAQQALADLEQRYAGREDLLVDYPVGSQSPLRNALEELRNPTRKKS
jgi:hypothetical protein